MSGFLLGLIVGAWAGFLFGMVFLAAWINIKRVDRQDDDDPPILADWRRCESCGATGFRRIRHVPGCSQDGPASRCCVACGAFSSATGVILHYPACPQQSPVRQAFL